VTAMSNRLGKGSTILFGSNQPVSILK